VPWAFKTVPPARPTSATSIRARVRRVCPCPVTRLSFAPAQSRQERSSKSVPARARTVHVPLNLKAAIRHRADLRVANKSRLSKTVRPPDFATSLQASVVTCQPAISRGVVLRVAGKSAPSPRLCLLRPTTPTIHLTCKPRPQVAPLSAVQPRVHPYFARLRLLSNVDRSGSLQDRACPPDSPACYWL
jgi:hypothetical protein